MKESAEAIEKLCTFNFMQDWPYAEYENIH